jgi:subtilisin-like proprotein convertase family protein
MNYRLILKCNFAPILILLLARTVLAEEKELPPVSAQRILRSAHASNLSGLTSKKPGTSPHALTSTPIWRPSFDCPIEVARYGFVRVGTNFYIISGITTSGSVSTGVYRFNSLSRFWDTLASIPVGSEGPAAAYSSYDNKIYVADGLGGANLLRIYDIASNTWSAATARPGVTNSFGAAAGAYNGQINIAGGSTVGANDVYTTYNIPNGVWTTINNMPSRFYDGGYTQVGRYLYLVGGFGITSANSTLSLRLDMLSHTWTTGPTFTPQRADFALAASGSKLFAIGGDASGGGFFDPSSAVDELETATWPSGSWVSSPPDLPSPRQANQAGFFSALRMGGEIWSSGGITSNPPLALTREHIFRTNPCPSIFFLGPFGMYQTLYPGASGTQSGNVVVNGQQSVCGTAKPFPGIVNPTITFSFDQYSFTNNGPAACVTFDLDTACAGNTQLFAVAYLGSYDPTNLAKNYLGDLGMTSPGSTTFSVDVPANATVVLVVQQFVSHCDLYRVTVTGVNCAEFCSTDGPILIPAGAGGGSTSGPAGPYPSLVPVSAVPGVITSMSVELNDFNHSFSGDLDLLLVSPAGQKMVIMSDAGSTAGLDSIATLVLRDGGIVIPESSAIPSGMYSPTNYEAVNDTFPAPAPAGPYQYPFPGGTPAGTATLLSSFAGFNPNGNWHLFINDDANMDAGFLSNWCLKFHTIKLQLTNAASRKSHGGKTFDIDLPLTGSAAGVECRSAGGGGTHTLVFNFTTNVVSGSATVTAGIGSAGAAAFSGNTMTVPLSGVADQQKITVTLNGITDVSAQVLPATSVSMNVLLGDTTGNKTVNATDVSQVKLQSGVAVSAANFRNDTNVSGTINATDVSQVKLNSGHGVP